MGERGGRGKTRDYENVLGDHSKSFSIGLGNLQHCTLDSDHTHDWLLVNLVLSPRANWLQRRCNNTKSNLLVKMLRLLQCPCVS